MQKNRLKHLLLVLLVMANAFTAWAQMPEDGKIYIVKVAGKQGKLNTPHYLTSKVTTSGTNQRLEMLETLDRTDGKFYFRFTKVSGFDNRFNIYSVGAGQFLNQLTLGATAAAVEITASSDGAFFMRVPNASYYNCWTAYDTNSTTTGRLDRSGTTLPTANHFKWSFEEAQVTPLAITPNPANARATYGWNGKTLSDRGAFVYNSTDIVTTPTLTCTPTESVEFEFVNFTREDGTQVEQITEADLTQSVNITANFAPAFFSSSYGQKWIRVVMSRNGTYAWRLKDGTDFANKGVATAVLNNTDERFLWCFVGDANNFKIYNKVAGEGFALTAANNNDGTYAVLATDATAKSWKLAYDAGANPGYTFNLKDVTNSMSLNSYNGQGNDVRFYNATDGGGHWRITEGMLAPAVIITPNIPGAKGLYTWNNGTIRDKGMIALPSIGAAVAVPELTGRSTDDLYTFQNFTNETTSEVVTQVADLQAPLRLKANFESALFSTNYGDRWVRITAARNNDYAWRMDDDSVGITSKAIDMADERFLWCLVGTADSFKIYNKVTGESKAATMVQNPVDGSLVTMTATAGAASWQMLNTHLNVQDGPGYTLKIVGTSSAQAPNAYGGVNGGTIKCYAETDGGSHWNFGGASVRVTLNATATNLPTNLPDTQNRFSNLNVRYGTALSQASTTGVVATEPTKVLYLPKNSSFSVAPFKVLRNYRLTNLTEGSTTANDSLYIGDLNEDKTIAINYSFVDNKTHYVFYGPPATPVPFRIPAVAVAANGHVIAMADYRYNGADIGFGNGNIDIVARVSKDNGATWEPRQTVIAHGTTPYTLGYGDAALVADRTQNKALLIAVTGNKTFWNATNTDPMRVVRIEGNYDDATDQWQWSTPEEKTSHFYNDVYNGVTLNGMFFASGRLMQSRVVKVGEYYRVYGVIAGREQGSPTTTDNRVVFSDDFGKTWKILGGIDSRPIPSGDEAKCEEFPDGTIVVSSRMSGGRRVNVFTFGSGQDDVKNGVGTWGAVATGITTGTNACDGELYFVNAVRKSDNSKVLLAFQSVPNHSARNYVSVWYKEVTDADKAPATFAALSSWTLGKRVSETQSAYSTMDLQKDNKFAFLWEEEGTPSIGWGGYNIAYVALSVEDLTGDRYSIDTEATTDISDVKVSSLGGSVFYDLNGRRVNTLTRGKIYVTQDGKKLLVK